ncbi:AimR family lysis-lysogeny pheromone receptor [Pontibacillus sp. HMF3514]|uniref:AimR family lysis-lysogeny pheromone receptor n=1 Tax=Pontibacillus sp. HMF3514 TaxID=2692425 RepID=UPI00131FC08E|nr:AimR family lysis-lysogeny pheromone receptor [Pontibacillus sp. HMF3514]QHE51056.1 hypothetical protein GS400_02920 [Pontibacillus sp. HMF3514]
MRNEENSTQVFSSEQLKTVQDMIGENEPSLFSVLQELSKKYDEKTTIFLTKEFCLNCQTYENQRVGMEFLYMNGFREELKTLVNINKDSSNQNNVAWGEVYDFILHRKIMAQYRGEVLSFVDNYETDDEILRCLLIFIKIYGHIDLCEFDVIENYREELTSLLLNIDDTLLRIYFQLRENELLFLFHWMRNEVDIARNYAHNIIDNIFNQEKKCFMHIHLSETYIFEDFDLALEHVNCAREIALDYDLDYYVKAIDNNVIPFISAINGKYQGISTNDIAEQAHLAIAAGDNEKAIKLLKDIEKRTPFQDYYYGLAANDISLLLSSYKRFLNERNDQFFARLPYLELKKRGWNENEKNYHAN